MDAVSSHACQMFPSALGQCGALLISSLLHYHSWVILYIELLLKSLYQFCLHIEFKLYLDLVPKVVGWQKADPSG